MARKTTNGPNRSHGIGFTYQALNEQVRSLLPIASRTPSATHAEWMERPVCRICREVWRTRNQHGRLQRDAEGWVCKAERACFIRAYGDTIGARAYQTLVGVRAAIEEVDEDDERYDGHPASDHENGQHDDDCDDEVFDSNPEGDPRRNGAW